MQSRAMWCVVVTVVAAVLQLVHGGKTNNCLMPDNTPAEARLRNDIFCLYDRMRKPRIHHNDFVNISLRLDLKYLDMDITHNLMMVHGWFVLEWNDEFLKWESVDYDKILRIVVPADKIWVPSLAVFNSAWTTERLLESFDCAVYCTGDVVCTPEIGTPVLCQINNDAWPDDIQMCSMFIATIHFGAEKLNLKVPSDVVLDSYTNNRQWKLLNSTAKYHQVDDLEGLAEYFFQVQRHAAGHRAAVFMPSLVVASLVLMSFWLRPGVARIGLCCVALTLDLLFIQYLGMIAPTGGTTAPAIMIYYRNSMILAWIALVIGLLSTTTMRTKQEAPSCLVSAIVLLLRNDAARWCLSTGEVEDSTTVTWRVLSTLIDRLAFVISLIVHVAFLTTLMPPSQDVPA